MPIHINDFLGAFSPQAANSQPDPSIGAHVYTPQNALDDINSNLSDADEPYADLDSARKAGYNIPDSPVYHDQAGNDITDKVNSWQPMQTPTLYQRMFNRQAAANEDAINTQYRTQPQFASLANRTGQNLRASDIAQGASVTGFTGDPYAMAAVTPNADATTTEAALASGARIKGGIIPLRVSTEQSGLGAQEQENQNLWEQYKKAAALGQPQLDAWRNALGAKASAGESYNRTQLQPGELTLGMGAQAGAIARQPDETAALAAQADRAKQLAQGEDANTPIDVASARLRAFESNYQAGHPPARPFITATMDSEGNTSPAVRTPGAIITPQGMMTQEMQKMYGGETTTLPSGLKVKLPQTGESYPYEQPKVPPISGGGITTPAAKAEDDQQPYVDGGNNGKFTIDSKGQIYKDGKPATPEEVQIAQYMKEQENKQNRPALARPAVVNDPFGLGGSSYIRPASVGAGSTW